PGHGERSGRGGRQGPGPGRAAECGRLSALPRGTGAHHPVGARAALRARPRPRACRPHQRAVERHQAGGSGLIGAVLLDKPAGVTSHDVVQRVRRMLCIRAAGHTGTLDPFATGLLVVLLGRATRLARYVEAQSKTYLATARLGIRTDTDDLTGRVVEVSEGGEHLTGDRVATALAGFAGTQLQRPPQYSAKHVGGERSYAKARRGEQVELSEVSVTVRRIELLRFRAPL